MCLIIVLNGVDEEMPLVVAANRDERFNRPATAMTVLQAVGPRILGGRDELAGGTWLAVNEHGVVAGLTNRPSAAGRDPKKRSRGELPIRLARHADATAAVGEAAAWRPRDYNAAWLLVGDRRTLYFVDLTGQHTAVRQLGRGLHVLENRPLGEPSPKLGNIRELLSGAELLRGEPLVQLLWAVLQNHTVPRNEVAGATASNGGASPVRPVEADAACVHLDDYGTRSSTIVRVPVPRVSLPDVRFSDGPACMAPMRDANPLWSGEPASA
jgi:uncharacterized protein with NRDE domain